MTLPVLILAAGFGTRMGALTQDRPKPLINVAGRPLLDHALNQAKGYGPIAVNCHYKAHMIADHLADTDVILIEECPDILDSGGAVRNAWPQLGAGRMATLNADAVWQGPPVLALLQSTWRDGMGGLLALVPESRAIGRTGGDFALGADSRIVPDKTGMIYTGAQILAADAIAAQRPGIFSMWDIWNDLLAQGRLHGCVYSGRWVDVGHPDGIGLAEAMQEGGDV